MRVREVFVAILALGLAAGCEAAESGSVDAVQVTDANLAAPAGSGPAAMYLTVRNGTSAEEVITGVVTPVAGQVELHTQEEEGGRVRMARLDEIPIPAGEQVRMTPGGLHVMLIDVQQDLSPGDSIDAALILGSGATVPLRAAVVSYAELAQIYEAADAEHRPGRS